MTTGDTNSNAGPSRICYEKAVNIRAVSAVKGNVE